MTAAEDWRPDGVGLPEEARALVGSGSPVHLRLRLNGTERFPKAACGAGLGEWWTGLVDEVTCTSCRENGSSAEKGATAKCRFMAAAYPTLDVEDTCTEHRHDAPTFALAEAMAKAFQDPNPSDEQIGWLLNDAAAVVDDFDPAPLSWAVTKPRMTREVGLDFTLTINGIEYVIQENDSGGHVESHPVSREEWESWLDDDADDEDCQHEWELRSEHDSWVCAWCQAETTSPSSRPGGDRDE